MIKITIKITKEISTITISQTIPKYQQIQVILFMKRRLWDARGLNDNQLYRGAIETAGWM
jgi:hypothetical protein